MERHTTSPFSRNGSFRTRLNSGTSDYILLAVYLAQALALLKNNVFCSAKGLSHTLFKSSVLGPPSIQKYIFELRSLISTSVLLPFFVTPHIPLQYSLFAPYTFCNNDRNDNVCLLCSMLF